MHYLSKDELLKLLAQAKSDNEDYWAMILVGYWHGLRASEIINLCGSQFDGGYLTVQRLKGSLKTTHNLISHPNELLNEKEYFENKIKSVGSGRLFNVTRFDLNKRVHKYGAKAGIPKHLCHPHILKHTCAKHHVSMGVEKLRMYVGHKDLGSTGAYLSVSDQEACEAFSKVAGIAP